MLPHFSAFEAAKQRQWAPNQHYYLQYKFNFENNLHQSPIRALGLGVWFSLRIYLMSLWKVVGSIPTASIFFFVTLCFSRTHQKSRGSSFFCTGFCLSYFTELRGRLRWSTSRDSDTMTKPVGLDRNCTQGNRLKGPNTRLNTIPDFCVPIVVRGHSWVRRATSSTPPLDGLAKELLVKLCLVI